MIILRVGYSRAELKQWLAETPSDHRVKGMFITSLLTAAKDAGARLPTTERFLAFKDYPMSRFMALALDCSEAAFPQQELGEGLRRLGRLAYPTFNSSTIGKVVLSVAGRDWHALLGLVSRSYALSVFPGKAKLAEFSENRALVTLRNLYNFNDTYHVGVFEGAMQAYGIVGTVTPTVLSRCNADLIMHWKI